MQAGSHPVTSLRVAQGGSAGETRAVALVVACLALPVLLLHVSFTEMVGIWSRSGTFTHGFLVLPLFMYLVWERRRELAVLPVRPFLPAVVAAAGVTFVWLLGELASARTPSFFAAVLAIPVCITAVLGLAWLRALAFPLAMLLFAVPFGEVFVPTMIEWTADFTVAALRFSGVPVLREGQNFVIPSGHWSVVDACSGIRYLIASLFAGLIFAWMMFRSPRKRLVFVAFAVAVPIVANWLRAYGIVMIGHLSDNRIATGVDHILYGWVFFGIVMGVMFMLGARYRDDVAEETPQSAAPAAASGTGTRAAIAAALFAACLVTGAMAAARLTTPPTSSPAPALVVEPAGGWTLVREPFTKWHPQLTAPTGEETLLFRRGGRTVALHVGFYRNQRQDAELVNSTNLLVPSHESENLVAESRRTITLDRNAVVVPAARLKFPGETLLVWRWYWLGSTSTASDLRAKLDLAFDRLRGNDDTSAWIAVYTPSGEDDAAATQALDAFVADMAGPLDAALLRTVAAWK